MERGASGIRRREFLSYSICSAGLLVPGVLSARTAASAGKSGEAVRAPKKTELRIGYCERSDAFADLRNVPHGPFEPTGDAGEREGGIFAMRDAASLSSGDRTLAERGARVTLLGMHRVNDEYIETIAPLMISVSMGPANAPIAVETFQYDGISESSPMSFRVPVLATRGLELRCASNQDAMDSPEALVRLNVDATRGPKLRRGIYCVAWAEEGSRALPNWSQCEFETQKYETQKCETQGAEGETFTASRLRWRGSSRNFAYLLLSIDHADPALAVRDTDPEAGSIEG